MDQGVVWPPEPPVSPRTLGEQVAEQAMLVTDAPRQTRTCPDEGVDAAAGGIQDDDLGDAVGAAADEQGVGVDDGDVGDLRIADDDRGGRAIEVQPGDMVDLDAEGPALGQGRRSGSEDRQGQESGGDAAHDRLHLNLRARGAREDCPPILKKALRTPLPWPVRRSEVVNYRQG